MRPETKLSAVKDALNLTFGVDKFESIERMTKGLTSTLVFKIVVKGIPYLLRIIIETDMMNDPTNQFNCMKAAAAVGIAPRVLYTSIEDRISITDFIDNQFLPVEDAIRILSSIEA